MVATWFISDTHFGHANIIKFTGNDGERIRQFASVEEHDETIIENVNKLVKPHDRLYIMGDVAIGRKHIATVGKLNGKKKLLKGNHDIFRLKDYIPYFEDISSYRVYPNHGIIVSHIPLHTCQLERRFRLNAHGHMHSNVIPDVRYLNLCLEHTNFGPISFDEVVSKVPTINI